MRRFQLEPSLLSEGHFPPWRSFPLYENLQIALDYRVSLPFHYDQFSDIYFFNISINIISLLRAWALGHRMLIDNAIIRLGNITRKRESVALPLFEACDQVVEVVMESLDQVQCWTTWPSLSRLYF